MYKYWPSSSTLAQVQNYYLQGWPWINIDAEFKPCVLEKRNYTYWMDVFYIELDAAHTGATKIKVLARAYVWWPKQDSDVEQLAKNCNNSGHPSLALKLTVSWFTGPFLSNMYLVLICATFAIHGNSHKVFTVSGPTFTSNSIKLIFLAPYHSPFI